MSRDSGSPCKTTALAKNKKKGEIVTCNVIETGDFGVKVRIGDKGPVTIIKNLSLLSEKQTQDLIDGLKMIN